MDKNSEINKVDPDMTAEYSRVLDMLNQTAAERDAAIARAEDVEARVRELEEGIRRFMIPWAPHLPVCWREHFEDLTAPIFCGLRDVEGTDQ